MNYIYLLFCLTAFVSIINADISSDPITYSGTGIIHPNDKTHEYDYHSSFPNLIAKLSATSDGAFYHFGDYNAVAISNNRIVVGAYGYNGEQGAAYVFTDLDNPENGHSYTQTAFLMEAEGATLIHFGESVDIDGDIIVIGASHPLSYEGAAYIFRIFDDGNISQVAKITAQNGAAFGASVAIHGKFILVGSPGMDRNGDFGVGGAFLFVNPSNDPNSYEWTQIMQFQPNDLELWERFGSSVAIDDHIIVIGTNDYYANAVYIFVPVDENVDSLSTWTQIAKLVGPRYIYFGSSVAVAGNSIVVTALGDDNNNGMNAGAVFVFAKANDNTVSSTSSPWTEMTKLLAADGDEEDGFGSSVAIFKDASTVVVGAVGDNLSTDITDSGAVYLFRANSLTETMVEWTQMGNFVGEYTYGNLGSSIAVERSIAVVGTGGADVVYILDLGFSSQPTTPTADLSSQPTTLNPSPSIVPFTSTSTPSHLSDSINKPTDNLASHSSTKLLNWELWVCLCLSWDIFLTI